MNKKERKNSKSSGSLGIGIIALIMLLNAATGMDGDILISIIVTVLVLGGIGFGLAYVKAKKKSKAAPFLKREITKETVKNYFMREEFNEETISCTHSRGREKYIHQLDGFLATGLIDRTEYSMLKERYDKLNIPENMH